jgi:hypothetical protein
MVPLSGMKHGLLHATNPSNATLCITENTECTAFCPVVWKLGSSPPPHPQASVAPPHFGSKGVDTLAWEGGDGGDNTLILYVYYNFSTLYEMYVLSKSEAYLNSSVVFMFYCLTSISM